MVGPNSPHFTYLPANVKLPRIALERFQVMCSVASGLLSQFLCWNNFTCKQLLAAKCRYTNRGSALAPGMPTRYKVRTALI